MRNRLDLPENTEVAPAVIMTAFPHLRVVEISSQIMTIGALTTGLFAALSVTLGPPIPVANNYIETVTWYENNYLYIHQRYWQTKSAFDNGSDPIYDSGVSIAASILTF